MAAARVPRPQLRLADVFPPPRPVRLLSACEQSRSVEQAARRPEPAYLPPRSVPHLRYVWKSARAAPEPVVPSLSARRLVRQRVQATRIGPLFLSPLLRSRARLYQLPDQRPNAHFRRSRGRKQHFLPSHGRKRHFLPSHGRKQHFRKDLLKLRNFGLHAEARKNVRGMSKPRENDVLR